MRVLLLIAQWLIPVAEASSPFQPYCDALGNYCGSGNIFLIQLALQVSELVFKFIVGISIISIMIAGVKLITTAEGGKEDAKKIIQYSLLGLAFAIVGFALVHYVCVFAVNALGEDIGMCTLDLPALNVSF